MEMPTGKNFEPTKARWDDGTRPIRPTMTRDTRNLAHSCNSKTKRSHQRKKLTNK